MIRLAGSTDYFDRFDRLVRLIGSIESVVYIYISAVGQVGPARQAASLRAWPRRSSVRTSPPKGKRHDLLLGDGSVPCLGVLVYSGSFWVAERIQREKLSRMRYIACQMTIIEPFYGPTP